MAIVSPTDANNNSAAMGTAPDGTAMPVSLTDAGALRLASGGASVPFTGVAPTDANRRPAMLGAKPDGSVYPILVDETGAVITDGGSVQEPNPHYLGEFATEAELPAGGTAGDFADVDETGTEWVWTSDDPAGWTDSGNPIGTTPHWITVDLNYLYQLLGDV
ncbi:MAG: hypothetical protein LBT88_06570, partial [Oscillospiraceae bacterium]|nr:hypothetical protein [Oscillospiraceae bacterium]